MHGNPWSRVSGVVARLFCLNVLMLWCAVLSIHLYTPVSDHWPCCQSRHRWAHQSVPLHTRLGSLRLCHRPHVTLTATPSRDCMFSASLWGDLSRSIFSECTTFPGQSLYGSPQPQSELRDLEDLHEPLAAAWTVCRRPFPTLDQCCSPMWAVFTSTSKSGLVGLRLNSISPCVWAIRLFEVV